MYFLNDKRFNVSNVPIIHIFIGDFLIVSRFNLELLWWRIKNTRNFRKTKSANYENNITTKEAQNLHTTKRFIIFIYEPARVTLLCLMESRSRITIVIANADYSTMHQSDPHYSGLFWWFCIIGSQVLHSPTKQDGKNADILCWFSVRGSTTPVETARSCWNQRRSITYVPPRTVKGSWC